MIENLGKYWCLVRVKVFIVNFVGQEFDVHPGAVLPGTLTPLYANTQTFKHHIRDTFFVSSCLNFCVFWFRFVGEFAHVVLGVLGGDSSVDQPEDRRQDYFCRPHSISKICLARGDALRFRTHTHTHFLNRFCTKRVVCTCF